MGTIWRDLFYTFRTLRKSPGFTAIVVLILGLGIGANTAIFSVVNAVILRPLPYRAPERLVMLPAAHRPTDMGAEVSVANFLDWRRESHSFEQLGAFGPLSINLTGGDSPERIEAAQITPAALTTLGTQPLLGRLFLPDEEKSNSRVTILSYGLWKSHFGGDRNAVGKVVRLSGIEYPIVGVMPQQFHFPNNGTQLWVPIRMTESRIKDRQERWMYVIGRLKNGVSLQSAQREMDNLTGALAQQFPSNNKDWGTRLVPLQEHLVGKVRPALLILLTTVLLVLLLACANIANLQLARAATRQTEMAIRSAMGAPTSAVLRQLLFEGLTLAALGGLFGLVLAHWGLRLLIALSPSYIPRLEEVSIDGRVLVFTLGIAILTGVIFGLVPVFSALKPDLVGDLRQGGRGASSGVRHIRFRRLLTVTEVASALVLLIGAGLLLSSLTHLQRVDPGFTTSNVLTMEVVLGRARYSTDAQRATFYRQFTERAAAIPGVQSVGGISNLPLSGSNSSESYVVDGQPPSDPNALPEAGYSGVTAGYFKTLQIPLLQGREFSAQDTVNSPKAIIVNKTFTDRYWSHESAVGKRVTLMGGSGGKETHEVIGVIGDVHHTRLDVPTVPEIYVSTEQHAPWDNMVLVVRSKSNLADLSSRLRAVVASLDPEQPVSNVKTMEVVLAESTSEPKFYAVLLSAFAGLAFILSAMGIYSIISYSVAQRRHEIGIRVALGAQRSSVLTLVVGEGMVLAAIGIAAGLILAWLATHGLSSLLFGVQANDPLVFAAAVLLLSCVAMAASLIPAYRASRVSPMTAFRTQ
ncbi:MAG TPA: ABC transporter permease [Thermoanaerobaculia bacterium]|jgi:putative ABC transport system permease protein|nr:ABC transporter permease [Thermoanaerobaculia bacterium]